MSPAIDLSSCIHPSDYTFNASFTGIAASNPRTKPRLTKLRRKQPRGSVPESKVNFTSFHNVAGNNNEGKFEQVNCSRESVGNAGSVNVNKTLKILESTGGNVPFVFGDDYVVNRNVEKTGELLQSVTSGFVFGANKVESSNSLSSEKCGLENVNENGAQCKVNENVNFMFGTDGSAPQFSLKSQKGSGSKFAANDCGEKQGVENGPYETVGVVFGDNNSKAASDVKVRGTAGGVAQELRVESSSSSTKGKESESCNGSLEDGVFVFGSIQVEINKSSSVTNERHSGNRDSDACCRKTENDGLSFLGEDENKGFIFGVNCSKEASDVKIGVTTRVLAQELREESSSSVAKGKGKGSLNGSLGNGVFVFGSNQVGMNESSNGTTEHHSGDIGFDDCYMKNENGGLGFHGKFENMGFVFGVNTKEASDVKFRGSMGGLGQEVRKESLGSRTEGKGSDSLNGLLGNGAFVFGSHTSSNGTTKHHSEYIGFDDCYMKNENDGLGFHGKFENLGFVFGVNRTKAASDMKFGGSMGGLGQEVREESSGSSTEGKGSESLNGLLGNGAFVFGSHKSSNGTSDRHNGNRGSDDCYTKSENDGCGFHSNGRCNFEFGKDGGGFGSCPSFKLPDEFMKLNISHSGETNGIDNCSGEATGTISSFVLGSQKVVYPDSLGSSDNTSHVQTVTNLQECSSDENSDSYQEQASFEFQVSSLGTVKIKDEIKFASSLNTSEASLGEFITPPPWDPSSFKTNLSSELDKALRSIEGRSVKDKRFQKLKAKRRSLLKRHHMQDSHSKKSSSQGSPGSPMDFSPYQETVATDQCAKRSNVMSSGSSNLGNDTVFYSKSTSFVNRKDESNVIGATSGVNEQNEKFSASHPGGFGYIPEQHFTANCSNDGFIFGAIKTRLDSGLDTVVSSSDVSIDPVACGADTVELQESKSRGSGLDNTVEDLSSSHFVQDAPSVTRHRYRRKNRAKNGHDPILNVNTASTPFRGSSSGTSSTLGTDHVNRELYSSESRKESVLGTSEDQVGQGSWSAAAAVAWETCQSWRLRGNKAYRSGDLLEAEVCYTNGITSVSDDTASGFSFKPLVLCYSNRAATRLSLRRIREAIIDCALAGTLDPGFCKVHMRAANCHLLLGEIEYAQDYFRKCLDSHSGVCLDRHVTIEASEGLQKAQKVVACKDTCVELLQQRTLESASSALKLISEALAMSPYSEALLETKAEALYILGKYEEIIQLCEETLDFAERNFTLLKADISKDGVDMHSQQKNPFVRLWRWRLSSKSHFHLGKLEASLNLLEQKEQLESKLDKGKDKHLESSDLLAVAVRELLHHKNAGNEAFKSGRHAEALEHYNAALSSQAKSLPFAAICFCNRAAAHQALGHIADAIADCSLAMALDGNYPKAVSRRAALHEMIRDYAQAANDLRMHISILEKRSLEKTTQFSNSGGPTGSVKEIKQARQRLSLMEEKVRKEIPLDLYLILEIKPTDTASEIKKAYRKAALRHHPDKAGQFLLRNEKTGDVGQLCKKVAEEVRKDADRLFKMIGEAYAVLSDPDKRSDYDADERIWESCRSSTSRRESNDYGHPFNRSSNPRHQHETWRTYGKPV